jgi:hypothetical protein
MNSDSIFETPLIKENKGLITLFITITLAFLTIYYLYNKLQIPSTTRAPEQPIQPKVVRKRLTINAKDILFKDTNTIDISSFYTLIDRLSKAFDIYIIITIEENDNQNTIVDKLEELYKDNIVKKHVSSLLI